VIFLLLRNWEGITVVVRRRFGRFERVCVGRWERNGGILMDWVLGGSTTRRRWKVLLACEGTART